MLLVVGWVCTLILCLVEFGLLFDLSFGLCLIELIDCVCWFDRFCSLVAYWFLVVWLVGCYLVLWCLGLLLTVVFSWFRTCLFVCGYLCLRLFLWLYSSLVLFVGLIWVALFLLDFLFGAFGCFVLDWLFVSILVFWLLCFAVGCFVCLCFWLVLHLILVGFNLLLMVVLVLGFDVVGLIRFYWCVSFDLVVVCLLCWLLQMFSG